MGSETTDERAAQPSKLSPSVSYVVSVLDERIRSGTYMHGRPLPAERALCVEFATSRPTVRQAIDELERRQLIRRSARHRPVIWHTEATDAAATSRSIPSLVRQNVALWISGDPSDPGPMAITRSIYHTLPGDDYRLMLACPPGTTLDEGIRAETETLYRLAEDEECAGLILWHLGGTSNIAALEAFRATGKPLVFVDREPPAGFDGDYVGVHNEYAAADAVRHLIALGHRSIAHTTNSEDASAVRERREGYCSALREAGIPVREELILTIGAEPRNEEQAERFWRETVGSLFQRDDPPTAIFTVNDYSAYQVIRALRANGLRVPEDVAVIGFDDAERWISHRKPFTTSVSQPFERIGAEAVKLLVSRLSHEANGSYRHILLPAPLAMRQSSGGARGEGI